MLDIHVTVAAVIERDGKYLLVEEKSSRGDIVYNQPAGHVDPNESIIDAVIREVHEETGLSFTPEYLIGNYFLSPATNGKHYLRFCFYGTTPDQQEPSPIDSDILATHWKTIEDICALGRSLRSALVLQCLDDYLCGKRYSLDQFHFCSDELNLAEVCYNRLPQSVIGK
ncbi:NUDIX hydrolase [Pleionea sp. CnH1-48]|uniref:NUDIX hydrolase n=1 Tax=Pleionea sp. CnH1-48 TaxID=2954494 RepID=UPI00209732C4|nr:NUDIX hydrolase [Pleionea sp. CnH1-48]MCO7222770.1 NUDIX hydrolase [Pleionea sp. CnH1-48]